MSKDWINNVSLKMTAAFLLSGFFIYGCENSEREIKELTERKIIVEEGLGITSYLSQEGNMRARLIAPKMLRYLTDTVYVEFPQSLHVDFYDQDTKVESHLDARYGKYLENQSKVFLKDSVVVFNIKGDTLWAPELWWDQQTKKIYTDKVVRIHTKDKLVYGGRGFESDQDLSSSIVKYPTGNLYVSDSVFAE